MFDGFTIKSVLLFHRHTETEDSTHAHAITFRIYSANVYVTTAACYSNV